MAWGRSRGWDLTAVWGLTGVGFVGSLAAPDTRKVPVVVGPGAFFVTYALAAAATYVTAFVVLAARRGRFGAARGAGTRTPHCPRPTTTGGTERDVAVASRRRPAERPPA